MRKSPQAKGNDLDSDEVKQYLAIRVNLGAKPCFLRGRPLIYFKFTPVGMKACSGFPMTDVKLGGYRLSSSEHIGLWYLDPLLRKGKRLGAWATTYVATLLLMVIKPYCPRTLNFVKRAQER